MLSGLAELDGILVGGKRVCKRSVLFAMQCRGQGASYYLATQVVKRLDQAHAREFSRRLHPANTVCSDVFPAKCIFHGFLARSAARIYVIVSQEL